MRCVQTLLASLCLLAMLGDSSPARAEEYKTYQAWRDNLEWSPTTKNYDVIHAGGPALVSLYFNGAAWDRGTPAWKQKAAELFACKVRDRYKFVKLRFPYNFRVLVRRPMAGGNEATERVLDGVITTCDRA